MGKCGNTCCVLIPTPKNATKKGTKSFSAFIWGMFSLMIITYFSSVPMVFLFTIGGAIIPVGILSIIFAIMFTPSCKISDQLRRHYPAYSKKLSKYVTISWALAFVTFVSSMCAGSMFYNGHIYRGSFYEACVYGSEYTLNHDYDERYEEYIIYDLKWNYDKGCAIVMCGLIFAIITSITGAAQLAFIPCCLYLQYYTSDEVNKEKNIKDATEQIDKGIERYKNQTQIIDPDSQDSWDDGKNNKKDKNKNKNRKMNNEVPINDPRVEQLIYAIQGIAGQIKNLQDGIQTDSIPQIQPQTQMEIPSQSILIQQPQQIDQQYIYDQ